MCSCQISSPIEFFFLPFGRGVHALASNLEAGCTSKCMHFPQIPIHACLLVLVLVYYRCAAPVRLLADALCILFKNYSGHIENIDDITKNFNSHMTNKLFIYGDEINANAKKVSDKLKQVITRPTQNLEKKGMTVLKLMIILIISLQQIMRIVSK